MIYYTMIQTLVFYEGIIVENRTYSCCRIPAIIKTTKNTLLAFCEGRPSQSDTGCIDTLTRRSSDNGLSWSPPNIVWSDDNNVFGNPCPIVDEITNRIHLLMTWNRGDLIEKQIMTDKDVDPRLPYYCYSDDDGISWSTQHASLPARVGGFATPVCIKEMATLPGMPERQWRWYSTGPGNGIQLKTGIHKNRLIAPCNHSTFVENSAKDDQYASYHSHILYSDDHGISWNIGAIEPSYTNESCIVEIDENTLMHNMRLENECGRGVGISTDGGQTTTTYYKDSYLDVAVCQGSIIKIGNMLLYSGPASYNRENLTIFVSLDYGKTWNIKKTVYRGPCGYSNLIQIDDKHFGILYERDYYNKIVYKMLSVDWLLENDEHDDNGHNSISWYYKPYITNDPDIDITEAKKIEFDKSTSAYLEDMYQIRMREDVYNITIDDQIYRIRFDKNNISGLEMQLIELDEYYCLKMNINSICIHELLREKIDFIYDYTIIL